MTDSARNHSRSADVQNILAAIPQSLRDVSGAALYTGLLSWTTSSPLYVLGINPGGDPADIAGTVAEQAAGVLESLNYSAYRDEKWENGRGGCYAKGRHPMQRSVLHLLHRLGLDPGKIPSSNMVYARSRQAHHIAPDDMRAWAEECWTFHAEMIERLDVRVVLCMGADVASFVRRKVGSHAEVDRFVEDRERRPRVSRTYVGGRVTVVHAAHPSRGMDWSKESCDLAPLVSRALMR